MTHQTIHIDVININMAEYARHHGEKFSKLSQNSLYESVSWYSYFHIGSQFCSACLWRVGTCRWRVDRDRRLFYWLNFVTTVQKIERRLGCVNVRPSLLSQWERGWSPSSTWNYVSTRKQQNTLQLTTITKIAVLQMELTQ